VITHPAIWTDLLSVLPPFRLQFTQNSPLFKKRGGGQSAKYQFYRSKKVAGCLWTHDSATRGRISPTYLGYSWRWSCYLFHMSWRNIRWIIHYTQLSLAQSGSWCLLTKLGPFVRAPGLGPVAHKMLQAVPRVDARTQQIMICCVLIWSFIY
jgi:hypothetical protein